MTVSYTHLENLEKEILANGAFLNDEPMTVLQAELREPNIYNLSLIHIYITAAYADNLFLPLALLAASTFLPPGVLILALKPWTLFLCLFLGWNVIFMKLHLLRFKNVHKIHTTQFCVGKYQFRV